MNIGSFVDRWIRFDVRDKKGYRMCDVGFIDELCLVPFLLDFYKDCYRLLGDVELVGGV